MLNGLQAIRAWASIAVMLFHLGGALASEKYFGVAEARSLFGFGTHGVLVFFVLSGFIIHHVHSDDIGCPDSLGRYLFRRFMRLFPSYWTVLFLVGGTAILTNLGAEGIPTDAWTILKTVFLIPQDKALVGGTGAPVVIVAWSLQYEILFYLAFGMFILSVRVGAVALVSFVMAWVWVWLSGQNYTFPGYLNLVYLALFAMGILASKLASSSAIVSRAPIIWRFSLLFLCVAWLVDAIYALPFKGETKVFSTTFSSVVLGVWATLLIASRAALDMQRPANVNLKVNYIAKCSYLIYLVHFPVISAAAKISVALGLQGLGGALLTTVIALPGTLILSAILHEAIEKPILTWSRCLSGDESGRDVR